ncbi:unnamed protein product [Xylocopa violacea]|uniref:Uncharacterized protein n=1 Tax=Xylocopa violacea TaxID=135666 RepID=A0ABP1N048_XYLVO
MTHQTREINRFKFWIIQIISNIKLDQIGWKDFSAEMFTDSNFIVIKSHALVCILSLSLYYYHRGNRKEKDRRTSKDRWKRNLFNQHYFRNI